MGVRSNCPGHAGLNTEDLRAHACQARRGVEQRRGTLARGARQLVVQDALDTMWSLAGSYFSSFTPSTNMGASARRGQAPRRQVSTSHARAGGQQWGHASSSFMPSMSMGACGTHK